MNDLRLPWRVQVGLILDETTNCWVWTRAVSKKGYGRIGYKGKLWFVHRLTWTKIKGKIPKNMQIDHKCRNILCANPAHLRLVTNKQNLEHRGPAPKNSSTGIQGVYWHTTKKKYCAQVRHWGRHYHAGYFDNLEDAERAVIAKRNELFTHNDWDKLK